MPETIFGRRGRSAMGAEEVRALRDELGWTQEQLADAVEVSPLEVSAWEAGAVTVDRDNAAALARVAWRERRERAWDAAGARPCAWGADARARLETSVRAEDWDEVLETSSLHEVHQKECAGCRRAAEVERAAPLPARPLSLSVDGFVAFVFGTMNVGERLPAPLRTLAQVTVFGGWLVLLMLVLALLRFIVEPAAGFEASPVLVLKVLAVFFGWFVASALWDEVYPAKTFRAGLFKAAITIALVAVMVWFGMDPLEQVGAGFLALTAVIMRREHREGKEADARQAGEAPPLAPDPGVQALPGPRIEPEIEPGAVRTNVEAEP